MGPQGARRGREKVEQLRVKFGMWNAFGGWYFVSGLMFFAVGEGWRLCDSGSRFVMVKVVYLILSRALYHRNVNL